MKKVLAASDLGQMEGKALLVKLLEFPHVHMREAVFFGLIAPGVNVPLVLGPGNCTRLR